MDKRILVIDDERTFNFPATYARTLPEALWLLCMQGPYGSETYKWDVVWLDHDMGDPNHEMMDLIKWLGWCAMSDDYTGPNLDKIVIHSANPVARENMQKALWAWDAKMVRAEDYL